MPISDAGKLIDPPPDRFNNMEAMSAPRRVSTYVAVRDEVSGDAPGNT